MKGRIRHLESLVVDLMNATSSEEAAPKDLSEATYHDEANLSKPRASLQDALAHPSTNGKAGEGREEQNHSASAFGRMKISSTKTSYVGDSHWTAILNDVGALLFEEKHPHEWYTVD